MNVKGKPNICFLVKESIIMSVIEQIYLTLSNLP